MVHTPLYCCASLFLAETIFARRGRLTLIGAHAEKMDEYTIIGTDGRGEELGLLRKKWTNVLLLALVVAAKSRDPSPPPSPPPAVEGGPLEAPRF